MALDAGLGGVSPLAGRVIFGLIMLALVAGHFTDAGTMVEYAPSKGLPFAGFNVIASGVMVVFGSVGLLLGVYPAISTGHARGVLARRRSVDA